MKTIPIAKPMLGEKEFKAVEKVISSGWITQGAEVAEFEKVFSDYVGSKYACAVSSCTTALHLALLVVGVKPGDTVITVSHSFIATANAVRYCGAEPVFIDIDLATFNMSPELLKDCLDNDCENKRGNLFYENAGRVAAILVVHQMGMPCDLKPILKLASSFNLPVVEDAACAIGSEIKINSKWEKIGKPHGDIACFSFHPRKVITTGEGGMLTTNNRSYDKKFKLLRQHGMSVPDTVRHKAKKVIFEKYIMTGYNYRLTDMQAAIGIEQLKKLPGMIKERRQIAGLYNKELSNIPWLKVTKEPDYCKTNWQSYPVMVKKDAPLNRNRLMHYLLERGIATRPGIMNAHQEKPYISQKRDLSKSDIARDTVLLLPLFTGKGCDIKKVIKCLYDIGDSL